MRKRHGVLWDPWPDRWGREGGVVQWLVGATRERRSEASAAKGGSPRSRFPTNRMTTGLLATCEAGQRGYPRNHRHHDDHTPRAACDAAREKVTLRPKTPERDAETAHLNNCQPSDPGRQYRLGYTTDHKGRNKLGQAAS